MNDNQGFSGTHMMLAVLGGAVAGAAVAMLTTPKSGPEARARLNEVVNNGKHKARQLPNAAGIAGTAARNAFTEAMEEATV